MDEIEKLMVEYVQTGCIFADRWAAETDTIKEDLPPGFTDYLATLAARQAWPEDSEQFVRPIANRLTEHRRAIQLAKDAAEPTSGKRFALEKREAEIDELSRTWSRLAGSGCTIIDRLAARRLVAQMSIYSEIGPPCKPKETS
ncbi:hypothetical protein [Limimaricola soesokkakensis]|uniref:hypothetical protein n=1 Tax=Limimaricola soesokkakensis TaxID=1343159 RepID=UPI0035122A5D